MRFIRSALEICAGAGRPHDRQQAHEGGAHRHQLRTHAADGAVDDRFRQVLLGAHLPVPHPLLVGEIEEQQHEHAGLGVEAHERDHADPHRDRHVVAERVEQPHGADQ
jgi:hypothetical protein